MRKIVFLLLTFSIFLCSFVTVSYADNEIAPCLESTAEVNSTFLINSSGLSETNVRYYCYDTTFSYARITIKLQKRNLLVLWKDITTWEDISYEDNYFNTFHYQVDNGTYRVNITYECFFTDGTSEVIERTLKYKY